jgi:hypothetical protein
MKYRIRFNKTRGRLGRGTPDHVWRIFDETGKEWIVKNFQIQVPCKGEKEAGSEDWNVVAEGLLTLDRETSTAIIGESNG